MAKQHEDSAPRRVARAGKIHPVPIAKMRVAPVHVTQRPFRPAWGKSLAKGLDLHKLGYPVVNHRDGIFWMDTCWFRGPEIGSYSGGFMELAKGTPQPVDKESR